MTMATIEVMQGGNRRWRAHRQPSKGGARIAAGARIDPIASLAHDMRGPLANLSLILESLGEKDARMVSRRQEKLASALKVIDRLESMLGGLIERSRLDDSFQPFEAVPVALPDVIEEIVGLNRPLARQRGVRLHAYSAEPLEVVGDRHLLMRAVDNLLTNAIKHSPRGGMVLVEAMPGDDEVAIRIEDDGPGFTDEDIARAFRPFTKLSARSDAPLASHGLGLSIVRQIAERHGGSVAATRAAKGRGAVLTLRLPSIQ